MPLHNQPVPVLRRWRNESVIHFLLLTLAAGYVGKVQFVDGEPVPHFAALACAALFALYSVAVLVKAYHRELQQRTHQLSSGECGSLPGHHQP